MLLASEFDKTKYLKAADFGDQEKKFRIKSVTPEELGVGKDKETKLVVWFTNDEHGLVLNRTNNRTLRAAYGDDTAGWVGKVIAIFPMMVDVRGKLTPALRVRIPPPKKKPEATATASPTPSAPSSGNGAAVSPPAAKPAAAPASDPELEPDPKLSAAEEMDDGIPENW
jgi:hypothetical protein